MSFPIVLSSLIVGASSIFMQARRPNNNGQDGLSAEEQAILNSMMHLGAMDSTSHHGRRGAAAEIGEDHDMLEKILETNVELPKRQAPVEHRHGQLRRHSNPIDQFLADNELGATQRESASLEDILEMVHHMSETEPVPHRTAHRTSAWVGALLGIEDARDVRKLVDGLPNDKAHLVNIFDKIKQISEQHDIGYPVEVLLDAQAACNEKDYRSAIYSFMAYLHEEEPVFYGGVKKVIDLASQ